MDKRCRLYDPETDKAQRLTAGSTDDLCGSCRERARDAQAGMGADRTDKHLHVRSEGSPREARLKLLKQELVAQKLGKRGDFREEIKKVRSYWRIDAPPIQRLPEPEEDVLIPPVLSTPSDLSDMHAAWLHHPYLDAWPPSDEHRVVRTLKRRWQDDLRYALRRGGVPERYLKEPSPHAGNPPTSTRMLPWLRFAAACVLCDVPVLEAPRLAEVGGVPSLRGEVEGEPMAGVIGPHQQRERAIGAAEEEAYREEFIRRLWELRSEVDDLDQAKRKVMERFGEELQKACDRARERTERWLEWNPPRKYLIEFDPKADKPADIEKTVDAVLAECEVDPQAHGRLGQGDLHCVVIALLLEEPDWTVDRVAAEFGYATSTVTTYRKRGKRILAD